jgi:hypothetical protein
MPPVPLRPEFYACVLHDADGNPISALNPLPVTAVFPPLATVSINDAFGGVTELSVKADGVAVPGTNGSALVGGKDALGDQYALLVDASGRLIVSVGPTTPGATITTPADSVVAPAATVALVAPPAGTTRMRVQVTAGSALTMIRVRELGGLAGAGVLLTLLASTMYGDEGGAIAPLEVENVAGPAAAVMIQFEG